MTNYVIPCIGQLAVRVNSDALWKPLNQSVLMKSRSEFPAIRLATLKVVQELYSRLGEDLLVLLPETIPFLAELMEDDVNNSTNGINLFFYIRIWKLRSNVKRCAF